MNRNRANMDRAFSYTQYQQGLGGQLMGGVGRGIRAMGSVGGLGTPFTGSMGPMMQGQGMGAMAYHGGLGQAINQMTGGVFARSAGFAQGMPGGAMNQLARDEMAMRSQTFFSDIASDYTLGLGDYFGAMGPGLQARRQQGIAQMVSGQRFSRAQGGTALGFGVRSTSGAARQLSNAMGGTMDSIYEASGKGMSREDMESLQTGALNVLGETRVGALLGQDASTQSATMDRTIRMVKNFSESLQVSYEAASEIAKSLSFAVDPQKNPELMKMMTDSRVSGMSGPQYAAMMRQQLSAARSMGAFGGNQAMGIALQGAGRMEGMFGAAQSGAIPQTLMSAWGGNGDVEQRFNAMQAVHRYGIGFGFSQPGISAMYQATPGAIPGMIGSTSLMDTIGAGASAMLSRPMAAMAARYDPKTISAMRESGMAGAFSYADQQGVMMQQMMGGMMNEGEGKAFRIRQFQRSAGIENESKAIAAYTMMSGLQDRLTDTGLSRSQARGMLSFTNRAMGFGAGNVGDIADVAKQLRADGVNVDGLSDVAMMTALGRSTGYAGLDPILKRIHDLPSQYQTGTSAGVDMDKDVLGILKDLSGYGSTAADAAAVQALPFGNQSIQLRMPGAGLIGHSVEVPGTLDPRKAGLLSLVGRLNRSPARGARLRSISGAGVAVDMLLQGASGKGFGKKVASLVGKPDLTGDQTAFVAGLDKDGNVDVDAIAGLGKQAMQDFLMSLPSGGAAGADRVSGLYNNLTTDSFKVKAAELMAGRADAARASYLGVWGNYHKSALSASFKDRLGTDSLPMVVRIKE